MKNLYKKLINTDISARAMLLIMAAAALMRLFMVSQQRLILYPESSMLDDMLMVQAAENILAGNWLGSYSYLTIGKHMLFALWLAGVAASGLSYLIAGQLLYTAAAFLLVQSLAPAVKNRLLRLLFFVYLIMSPASYADFTLRIYRDNITISFVMLVFAGFIAVALRLRDGGIPRLFLWSGLGGFSLGCSYLLREDGWWLLPFCAVGTAVCAFILLRQRPRKAWLRFSALVCSFLVAAVLVLGYCGINYSQYGRFIVSDLTSPEFQAAYGAMTRVVPDEEDYNPIVPIPLSSREKLYEISPLFAELRPYLESAEFSRWKKYCGDDVLEYSGGGFYWAVRNAASLLGYYETPDTAKAYFEALAAEINEGLDNADFEVLENRSGLNSPITADRILPTFKEALRSLATVVTYSDLSCSSEICTGSLTSLQELEAFANHGYQRTEKLQNPDTRVVLWVYDELGYPSVRVRRADEPVDIAIGRGTGSDVYLESILWGGPDLIYTDYCRYYVTFAGEFNSEVKLLLTSADGSEVLVPIAEMAAEESFGTLHYRIETVGSDYTESPTYGFLEIWFYRLMRVITLGYRMVNPLLFLGAAALFFYKVLTAIRRKTLADCGLKLTIALGILLMAALRIGMVSFAEVSAFGIGTFPMYLAAVYPLLIAFQFICLSLLWKDPAQ